MVNANYKSSFRVEKNRKKEIPGTSVLSMNTTESMPGTSVITLDKPVSKSRSRPHRWAKPSHESLVFSIDNKNGGQGLSIKKMAVPGTSTIKITQKKDTYISSKTDRIKYPEMQGKRLFKLADTAKRPAPPSPKQQEAATIPDLWANETILDFELSLPKNIKYNQFNSFNDSREPENVSMNVKPYTNFDAGKSLKFRLRPHDDLTALPGTSILFPENDVPEPYGRKKQKDWREFSLEK